LRQAAPTPPPSVGRVDDVHGGDVTEVAVGDGEAGVAERDAVRQIIGQELAQAADEDVGELAA
jgi:hypothetical protein